MTTPRARRSVSPSSLLSRPYFLALLLIILSLHGLSGAASNQSGPRKKYALIIGTVWGPQDRPVYGVKVKIRRAKDKRPKWELYSNHSGEFAQRVPPGKEDYVISADLKGYKPSDGKPLRLVQEVTVHVEYDERVDTGLHLTDK